MPTGAQVKETVMRLLPWLLSVVTIGLLVLFLLFNKSMDLFKEESVTIRSVDLTLPPPPVPPPEPKPRPQVESVAPSIDLMGPGDGPSLNYSDNPKLSTLNIEQIQQPEVDMGAIDFGKTLSVNFPLLEVRELDQVPRLVSTNRISFPREMRRRGINRIETKVEIIIDQSGKAFVKKIVDPVYPEMIEVIRKAINDSRFTIPKKDGKPVQAVYLYNLVFINRS